MRTWRELPSWPTHLCSMYEKGKGLAHITFLLCIIVRFSQYLFLKMCGYKDSRLVEKKLRLTSESVQGAALAFQCVDDIHGSDGLPLGVLGVGDSISDHIFKENFEDSSSFFVDQSADSLYSTTTRQSTDGWFCYSLDVVSQNLSVTLGASFSQSLSSFTSSRHLDLINSSENSN